MRTVLALPVVPLLLLSLLALPVQAGHDDVTDHKEFCDMDIDLIMDTSGSMNGTYPSRMDMAKIGASNFVGTLSSVQDRSALIEFNDAANRLQRFTFVHSDTDRKISALTPGGSTVMSGAITDSDDMFMSTGRPDARWIIVLLADGNPNPASDTGPTVAAANAAKSHGIEIFTISVQGANPVFMQNLASSPPSEYAYEANNAAEIDDAFDDIAKVLHRLCADFVVLEACDKGSAVFEDRSDVSTPAYITEVRWDWGDGTPDSVFTHPSIPAVVTHPYTTAGTYTVTQTVKDSLDGIATSSKEVTIDGCPTAVFSCVHLTHPDWLTTVFTDLSFDADDDIVAWEWEFGDGGTTTVQHPRHLYPAEGWYDVTLTVTDDDGHTDSVTKPCFADDNRPPVIIVDPYHRVYEGETVRFPVRGYDPDGDPVTYNWDRGPLPAPALWSLRSLDFAWMTVKGDRGIYAPVSFSISDPYWTTSDTTTVEVLPVLPLPLPENADHDGDGAIDRHDPCPMTRMDCASGLPPATSDGGPAVAGAQVPETTSVPVDADRDGDGVIDRHDNCPETPNRAQQDLDRDDVGDACDSDLDGDRVPERDALGRPLDNCPFVPNLDQADRDANGIGDACEGDLDGDGVPDEVDACPWSAHAVDACPEPPLARSLHAVPGDEDPTVKDAPEKHAPAGTASIPAVPLALLVLAVLVLARRR